MNIIIVQNNVRKSIEQWTWLKVHYSNVCSYQTMTKSYPQTTQTCNEYRYHAYSNVIKPNIL